MITRVRNSGEFLTRGLGWHLAKARLSLLWETIWPALAPSVLVLAVFAAAVLFDVFIFFPGWLHIVLLAVFGCGFLYVLWRGVSALVWPDRVAAIRRVQISSLLHGRPLEALEDHLPDGVDDPVSRALWQAHKQRMAAQVRELRAGLPRPGLAARDPWAVRIGIVLLVIVGAVVAGPDSGARLQRAFTPEFTGVAQAPPVNLELWITPPEYTRQPPIFPTSAAVEEQAPESGEEGTAGPAAIEVLGGSLLTAVVSGGEGNAELEFAGTLTDFEPVDSGNRKIERVIEKSGVLVVRHEGRTLGSWQLEHIPDKPPSVAFDGPPVPIAGGSLKVGYVASDDYGIQELGGEMRRTYEQGKVVGKEVSPIDLGAPGLQASEIRETSVQEFAPHPWAGMPVVLRLHAVDALGQVAHSEDLRIVLPEREFRHPVARQIIQQRRQLTNRPDLRPWISRNLSEIAYNPAAYEDQIVVFLGLSVAASRLQRSETAIPSVRTLLWDVALRIEDGGLSHAERELAQAHERLMQALQRQAPESELERLMQELEAAFQNYMRALASRLQNSPEAMEMDPASQILRATDLQRLMQEIRRMMRSGAMDTARQMLERLRQTLEALRNARVMPVDRNTQRGSQALNQLRQLIERQSRLMDRTFRQSLEGSLDSEALSRLGAGAEEQRELRRALEELRRMLRGMVAPDGPASRSMGTAGREMDGAAQELDQLRPGDAAGSQGRAIEALRRAGQGVVRQMMEQLSRTVGPGMGQEFTPLRLMRDPLGREWVDEEGLDVRRVHIPDDSATERAYEILEELRKRAGERGRPQLELDYINRLLQRF